MVVGSCRARAIDRVRQVLQHRRHHRVEIQRTARRQPRAIDVVQPSPLDVCGAGTGRHAGGRCRGSGRAAWRDRSGRARARAVHDLQSAGRRPVLADIRRRHRRRFAAGAAVARFSCVTRSRPRPWSLAVAWCITNDMVEGAAGVVIYGFGGLARNAPIAATALSLGLLMIPAVLALWPPAKLAAIHVAERRGPDCRPSGVLSRQDIEGRTVYRVSRRAAPADHAAWPRCRVLRARRAAQPCAGSRGGHAAHRRSVCRRRSSTSSTLKTSTIMRWVQDSGGRSC